MRRMHNDSDATLPVLGRSQCPWMPAAITRLYIERAAYERAGCPRAMVTAADIKAELAEVARRLEKRS
jgi:hypothetical protein